MQPDCGGRVIATENLTTQVRRLVDQYREAGGHGGILIGAMQGDADWDWRPLLLERGVVQLLRLSDPVLGSAPDKFGLFKEVLSSSRSVGSIAISSFGVSGDQLWVKRQFFKEVLSDSKALELAGPLIRSRENFVRLVDCVQQLHRIGIIHGHLCADNLAIAVRHLEILDVCFYVFSRISQRNALDVAPELQAGEPATEATDIYALGTVAEKILPHSLTDIERRLVDRMLAVDPNERPTLAEIGYAFREVPLNEHPFVGGPPLGSSEVKMAVLQQPAGVGSKPFTSTQDTPGKVSVNYRSESEISSSRSWLFLFILVLFIGSGVYFAYQRYSPWLYYKFAGSAVDDASFERFWKSGMPSLMQQVAKAALVDDNPAARFVVIRDALESKGANNQVRYDIIRIAFNPEWEGEISAEDRRIALSLALADLLRDEMQMPALPSLEKTHPGVVLAIAGNLAVEKNFSQLGQVSLTRMVGLPGRYGAAFDILLRLGVENMADQAARALSHLLLGNVNTRVIRAFFREDEEPRNLFIKLELVLMLSGDREELAQETYNVLLTQHAFATQLLQWFQLENVAGWEKLSGRDKLVLLSGTLPKETLQLEHYIDLLKFPRDGVRDAAKEHLIKEVLPETMLATIDFLAGDQNLFTRSQMITLVAALSLKPDQQYKILTDWFETQPDPDTLVNLLIVRSSIAPTDPFNVTAARYLSRNNWSGDLSQLKKLTMHSESLVRALAYSQLSVEKKEELQILKEMAKVEPDQRLRMQLQERLKDW